MILRAKMGSLFWLLATPPAIALFAVLPCGLAWGMMVHPEGWFASPFHAPTVGDTALVLLFFGIPLVLVGVTLWVFLSAAFGATEVEVRTNECLIKEGFFALSHVRTMRWDPCKPPRVKLSTTFSGLQEFPIIRLVGVSRLDFGLHLVERRRRWLAEALAEALEAVRVRRDGSEQ